MRHRRCAVLPVPAVGLAVAFLLLATGCGSGGGDGVPAPRGVVATLNGFSSIALTWAPLAGVDALEIQGRIAQGPWETVGSVPADAAGARIDLAPDAPEAADYGLRLRAVMGGAYSDWSAEAVVHLGVRPATDFFVSAQLGPPPVIGLFWNAGSAQADAIRLERRLVPHGAPAGAWSAMPGVPVAATYVSDTDLGAWVDGADVEYRLAYVKGGEASAPVQGSAGPAPPLAPVGLVATAAGPLAIRIDWTPRSTYATKQVVVRSSRLAPGTAEVATLPPGAASLVDTVPEPGAYVYMVSARVGEYTNVVNFVADSDPVVGFAAMPGLLLTPSTLVTPGGSVAIRDAGGHFATAEVKLFTVSAWRQGSGGWERHDTVLPIYPTLAPPGLLPRPDGGVELLYRTDLPTPPVFTREWFDGTWHDESVTDLRPVDGAVAPGGALHLVACEAGLMRHATNVSGAWSVESVPVSDYADRCAIAVGPAGDVRIAWTSPRPVPPGQGGSPTASDLHLVVGGAGGWVDEIVDVGIAGTAVNGRIVRAHAPTADRTVVIFEAPPVTVGTAEIRAVAREAGAWGAPVALGQFGGRSDGLTSASSPDGSRVVVAWSGVGTGGCCGATLALRAADGTWSTSSLIDTEALLSSGFGPDGKLWVLELTERPDLAGILYQEP